MPRRNSKQEKRRHTNNHGLTGLKNGTYQRQVRKLAEEMDVPFNPPRRDIIVLDIDGVLADFMYGLINRIGEPADWNHYELKKMYPDRYIQAYLEVKDPSLYRKLPVVLGAKKALQWLYDVGYDLFAVTARPQVDGMRDVTHEWLKRHFRGLISQLELVPGDKKAQRLAEIKPAFALDDSPEQVREANKLGVRCVLFTQPYNQQETGLHRTRSWSHFRKTLEEISI